jgi:hypothetical protein
MPSSLSTSEPGGVRSYVEYKFATNAEKKLLPFCIFPHIWLEITLEKTASVIFVGKGLKMVFT